MAATNRTQSLCGAEALAASNREPKMQQHRPTRLRRRAAMAVLVATVAVMVPRPAAALFPIPPAPVRFPIADVGHTILTLAEQYARAPLGEQRRLHNEMVLLIN